VHEMQFRAVAYRDHAWYALDAAAVAPVAGLTPVAAVMRMPQTATALGRVRGRQRETPRLGRKPSGRGSDAESWRRERARRLCAKAIAIINQEHRGSSFAAVESRPRGLVPARRQVGYVVAVAGGVWAAGGGHGTSYAEDQRRGSRKGPIGLKQRWRPGALWEWGVAGKDGRGPCLRGL
jgi:hypothetical protein